jgi:hypothetical protein
VSAFNDLLFSCVDNRIEAIRIGTSTPTRDVKRLTRLLCDKIENVDPGFGIELMRLAATRAEPLRSRQFVSLLAEDSDADVSDLYLREQANSAVAVVARPATCTSQLVAITDSDIGRAFDFLAEKKGITLDLATITSEDPPELKFSVHTGTSTQRVTASISRWPALLSG